MPDPARPEQDPTDRARRADHVLSLALPLAVIGFGVALSVSGVGRLLVDICRAALP